MDFATAYRTGRRRLSWFPWMRLFRSRNLLLSLDELREAVRPGGETYLGIRDVPVEKVIGTENRSSDFSMGFLPVHKWMEQRWIRVKDLLMADKIIEPVKLIYYGGYYFVRDGNHRVSVAKTNGIEFLTAEITEMRMEIKLPPGMNRQRISLLKAKYTLHQETGIFSVIPEENFFVNRPETWEKVKESIFTGHKRWFMEKNGFEPEAEILIQSWDVELYETTIEFIRKHQLPLLTQGLLETDVFCELMDLWSGMPETWFPEVYAIYTKKMRKRHFLRLPWYYLTRIFRYLMSSDLEERALFLQASRLLHFLPNANLPPGSKRWYRFLRKQLTGPYYEYLTKKLKRNPYMHELTRSWYHDLFEPAMLLHSIHERKEPFAAFYMRWMRSWQKTLLQKENISLRESFDQQIRKRDRIDA